MARIRSVHPGLFTDEAFVALSMPARILLIGIWTDADDHGVFEWKPLSLKMKLFAADAVDISALLNELASGDVVKLFHVNDKPFGAVRNFCKYQRPKKPSYKHKLPDEFVTYVASKSSGGEPVPHQNGTGSEKSPQREEGGGREGVEEKKVSRRVASATTPNSDFDEFWKEYPARKGDNPKAPAKKLFDAAVKQGADAKAIVAGVKAACAKNRDKIGTEFIPQAVKWLRDRRWEDYAAVGNPPSTNGSEPDWENLVGFFKQTGVWSKHAGCPEPGYSGCKVPREVLARHGYMNGTVIADEPDIPGFLDRRVSKNPDKAA